MTTAEEEFLHEVYLPVSASQFRERHFLTTTAGVVSGDRHLTHYRTSIQQLRKFQARAARIARGELRKATQHGRQIEKDERFWVAGALLAAFYPEANRRHQFASLLRRAIGETAPFPGFDTWESALAGELHLFFEVNARSPKGYRTWLKDHVHERVVVPYLQEAASKRGNRLEGPTKIDAVLVARKTGVAVFFEAKVLSDASPMVTYDPMRNQLARTIDIALEHDQLAEPLDRRDPHLTCVVLLTPRIFKQNPRSRYYGYLMKTYQERPKSLGADLPHRADDGMDWAEVSKRLGWLTFEDCHELVPGSCAWLGPSSPPT